MEYTLTILAWLFQTYGGSRPQTQSIQWFRSSLSENIIKCSTKYRKENILKFEVNSFAGLEAEAQKNLTLTHSPV